MTFGQALSHYMQRAHEYGVEPSISEFLDYYLFDIKPKWAN